MAVANNADDYSATRIGIYFPGVTPDLDGQCVSLEKWFLGEMCAIADWNAARGNANTCGRTLVNQGLAVEVPYDQRRRGDVVCLEYGTYGHVYIQLSGGRVFEENVNWPGVAHKIVDGDTVYASRIGSESEAWRAGKNPHVYRVKTYSEGGVPPEEDIVKPSEADVYSAFRQFAGKEPDNPAQVQYYMARDIRDLYHDLMFFEIIPKPPEVEQAFKDLQPWSPINTPPYTNQTNYYSSHPAKVLYEDLANGLNKKLAEQGTPPATPIDKAAVVDYINKNLN